MTEPIVVVARFHPKPGLAAEMITAMTEALLAIHAEPGCIYYAPHIAPDGSVVIVEKWESAAAFDAHLGSSGTLAIRTARAPYEAAPVTFELLAPAPAGHPSRGAL